MDIDEIKNPGPRLAQRNNVGKPHFAGEGRPFWGGELTLPSLDIARLDPDRVGARAAQYSKVQESSAL
ncbi:MULTISPECIES: hypothetical protein [unclassified Sphingopyxis]|jgi:hypothetical protein|uniref:hypothetical protein n=1 Tax=unclassified Sphingopyxis TaxID=2614943 RepID=UPI00128CD750|nr:MULTISPECIES: hypothetical protein [unclassified Sphingopyxis]USI75488.1 hypothetical protein KEC45_11930 [Sphingopyxis sp. USTB-05]